MCGSSDDMISVVVSERLMEELVKKGRGESSEMWNLEREGNILCSQKITWQEI